MHFNLNPFLLSFQAVVMHVLHGVAEGMEFIHSKNIIHGDLKYVLNKGWRKLCVQNCNSAMNVAASINRAYNNLQCMAIFMALSSLQA